MKLTKSDITLMRNMADNLENYLATTEDYIIIKGLTKEEHDRAVKKVRKLIKKLRKGKGEDVFDEDRFLELKRNGKINSDGI